MVTRNTAHRKMVSAKRLTKKKKRIATDDDDDDDDGEEEEEDKAAGKKKKCKNRVSHKDVTAQRKMVSAKKTHKMPNGM